MGSRFKNTFQRKSRKQAGASSNDTVSALTNSDPYEDDDISMQVQRDPMVDDVTAEPMTQYHALEMEQPVGRNEDKLMIRVNDRDVEGGETRYADYYTAPTYPGVKGGGMRSEDDDDDSSNEVYIVRQRYGYCSILFSLAQTAILVCMMVQCGIAPLQINPMIGPYPDVLSEWGAKNTVLILDDREYWRLLTPILLHAGVIHLLCNVAVQLETGVFFEKEWGSLRWCIVYLSSAIGSSILSCIVMPNALSVGSSGAVMGLFGAKLSEVVLRACERVRTKQDRVGQKVRREQCCVVSCSVVLILLFSFIPYVDWAAHVVSQGNTGGRSEDKVSSVYLTLSLTFFAGRSHCWYSCWLGNICL